MLAIVAAPIGAVLSSAGAVTAKVARERTGADELAQTKIEGLRALSYTQIGIVHGNPDGVLAASASAKLPSGEGVTVAWQVTWVNDKVPENPYQTNADYKKIVLTITRNERRPAALPVHDVRGGGVSAAVSGHDLGPDQAHASGCRDPVAPRGRERQPHRRA